MIQKMYSFTIKVQIFQTLLFAIREINIPNEMVAWWRFYPYHTLLEEQNEEAKLTDRAAKWRPRWGENIPD